MKNLDLLRQEINKIDKVLITEFEKRINCAKLIAKYKFEHEMPIFDKSREEEVIKVCLNNLLDKSNLNLRQDAESFIKYIMQISRDTQARQLKELLNKSIVAYQGEPGANSQAALYNFFGNNVTAISFKTFKDVFNVVEKGDADYGIIPIENTSTGGITQVYDLLGSFPLNIVGEQSIPIIHSLMGLKGSSLNDIKDIYSHEQAFMQCQEFLNNHNYNLHPYFNTAASAKYITEIGSLNNAAIANPHAAEIYGLDILIQNISDKSDNMTRFIVISRSEYLQNDANKASIIFTLKHHPGSLSDILNVFAKHGLNMVKIESRPLAHINFEYLFYIDFEGEGIKDSIDSVFKTHRNLFDNFKLLGVYKS